MKTMSEKIQMLIDRFADGNRTKFAVLIGTSEANVRNYLKGTSPKPELIESIVKNCGINYEWLLGDAEELVTVMEKEEPYFKSENFGNKQKCENCSIKDMEIELLRERIAELKEFIEYLKREKSG